MRLSTLVGAPAGAGVFRDHRAWHGAPPQPQPGPSPIPHIVRLWGLPVSQSVCHCTLPDRVSVKYFLRMLVVATGATPNLSNTVRSMPNIEWAAAWSAGPEIPKTMPDEVFQTLSPDAQHYCRFVHAVRTNDRLSQSRRLHHLSNSSLHVVFARAWELDMDAVARRSRGSGRRGLASCTRWRTAARRRSSAWMAAGSRACRCMPTAGSARSRSIAPLENRASESAQR